MTIESFGRYRVKRPLGQGGMAVVHLAYDPQMTREVAVKVLPSHLTYDPEFRYRLEREVQTVAQLEHPCIVPVYDYGNEDDRPYVVMRYMPGGSLLNRIKQKPLSPDELSLIISRLARALDKAHTHNIIHRDIKPGNILFDDQGQAYLSDFGLAKVLQDSATRTGSAIVGTPAYMSPEQGSGIRKLDGRSDIYGLGIIVFEALSGQLPFQADTPIAMVMQHLNQKVPSIQQLRPDLPLDYEIVIKQAMAKTPDQRYATAMDLAEDLAAIASGKTIEPRLDLQDNVTESIGSFFMPVGVPSHAEPVSQPAEAKTNRWQSSGLFLGALTVLGLGLLTVGIGLIIMFSGRVDVVPTPIPAATPAIIVNQAPTEDIEPTTTSPSALLPASTSTSVPTPTVTSIPSSTPTWTLTPLLPSSTPSPNNAPINSPTPAPITEFGLVIDSFEDFSANSDLNNRYTVNDAYGENTGSLKLVGAPHIIEGQQAIAFEFDIMNSDVDKNYSGFERDDYREDWSEYSLLCFWIESDGSGYDLVTQFGETDSEAWKNTIALSRVGNEELCFPLSKPVFGLTDWSPQHNNEIDLESISYYGFFVEGSPQGPGTIYIDNFRVTHPTPTPTPTPIPPVVPTATPTTDVVCSPEPQGEFRNLWQRHKSRLGCFKTDWIPTQTTPTSGFFAEQPFENGHMFWSEVGDFYLVTLGAESGTWSLFPGDTSKWEVPYKSCDMPTPPGLIHPVSGFGGVWCTYDNIRQQIGWGLKEEEGFTDLIQEFQGGFIFRDSDGATRGLAYVMFNDDGSFIRVPE